jgi:CRP-like cAMP-binding protein
MDLEQKVHFLRKCPLFTDLELSILQQLASVTMEKTFPAHSIVIEEGDKADVLYIIGSGAVKVYHMTEEGKNIPLNLLKEGAVIGEMALLDGHYRSATVETILPTTLLAIRDRDFRSILEKEPHFAIQLLTQLSKKIRDIDDRIVNNEERVPERTMYILSLLSKAADSPIINLTHEELADLIGITRPRLTEALHRLEAKGKISLSSHTIRLRET